MNKKYILLFFYSLFFLSPVFAQTDSVRPQPSARDSNSKGARDSNADKTRNEAPATRNAVLSDSQSDSARRISDSVRRSGKPGLKKSIATYPGGPDASGKDAKDFKGSKGSKDSGDSGLSGRDISLTSQAVPVRTKKDSSVVMSAPAAIVFWKTVLAANPFYNFTGQPVVEKFEMHRPKSKDALFYLLVGILFYFALIRFFFEKYFGHLITLFFRVSLRQQQIREQVLQTPLPSLLLNLLFILTGGLYACFLFYYSQYDKGINFWILYLECMMVLGGIYLLKFLILKFCGWVFNISRATDIYIFVVFLVNKMMGIFLLPFLILITFSEPSIREIFVTISLVMVFVLWGYRVLAAYRPIRNEIKLAPFSFFLYLCAFEIAPLLLIYKVLLQYLEKAY